jgi:hypothetical protein
MLEGTSHPYGHPFQLKSFLALLSKDVALLLVLCAQTSRAHLQAKQEFLHLEEWVGQDLSKNWQRMLKSSSKVLQPKA